MNSQKSGKAGIRGSEHLAEAMLLLAALIWGSGFFMTKLALMSGMTPALVMALRFSGAALIFGMLFRREIRSMSRTDWLVGSGVGALLFSGFMTQTIGLRFTTPSRNAFLTATYVVMVPLFSALLLRRRPQRRIFGGAILCFAGVAILTAGGPDLRGGSLAGDLLTLACAIFYAIHLIALEAGIQRVSVPRLIFLQMLTAAVLSLLALPFDWAPLQGVDWRQGGPAVLYLLLFSSSLAYFLQTTAQRRTSAAKTAILLSLEALFGSSFSVIFGFEPFSLRLLAGGCVIFASILLVEWPARPDSLP